MLSRISTQLSSEMYPCLVRSPRSISAASASFGSAARLSYPLLSRHYASGSAHNNAHCNSQSSSVKSNIDEFKPTQATEKNDSSAPSASLNTPVTNKAHFSEPIPLIEEQMSGNSAENSSLSSSDSQSTIIGNPSMKRLSAKELSSYLESTISSYNTIKSFSDLPLEFGYNQHMAIDEEMREKLRSILWKFNAPIKYAFAYGSGVFSQGKSSDASKPQVDLIFGVSYTQHWHSLNIRQNPGHYSMLRTLGSGAVSFVQDKIGAGVFFNPYVEIDGLKIKYGVVNIDTLLGDLTNWNSLYLAGRLHKPVKILRDEPRIRFTNQANLISALRTALLILPEEFTELDLYSTLAGISYMGDPRMAFGENPNKVKNIVNNQFLNFRNLYSPLLDLMPNVELQSSSKFALPTNSEIGVASMKQDMDPKRRGNMVIRLPKDFREKIYRRYQGKYERIEVAPAIIGSAAKASAKAKAIEEAAQLGRGVLSGTPGSFEHLRKGTKFDQQIACDKDLTLNVSKAIQSTVAWPSFTQSCKGILTAGVGRSVKYAMEKLKKAQAAKTN